MIDHANMTPVKQRLGTAQAASCHTVEIEGYVVEGHVPVAAINKMLTEQPDIRGLALPGMPMNSPGMGPEKKRQFAGTATGCTRQTNWHLYHAITAQH